METYHINKLSELRIRKYLIYLNFDIFNHENDIIRKNNNR